MAKVIVKGKYTQQYAITFTLNPKLYSLSVEEQYDLLQDELCDRRDLYDYHLDAIVELTKSYNIHAHGYIRIPLFYTKETPLKRIHDMFRSSKVIGFICVKPIESFNGWFDYCIKEYRNTACNMKKEPVIISYDGILKRKHMFTVSEGEKTCQDKSTMAPAELCSVPDAFGAQVASNSPGAGKVPL